MAKGGQSEFRVREWYVPVWRKKNPHRRIFLLLLSTTRYTLLILCVLCAILLLWPVAGSDYNEPISFLLARANATAWGIIGTLMGLLAASVPLLVVRQRFLSVALCVGGLAGLVFIGTSDPRSPIHLCVFIYLCLALIAWLWALGVLEEDPVLLGAALSATLGGVLCAFSMGTGERVVILSALVGIRGLFWGYLLE